ncbi:hypothetical protein CW751_12760 [Brumimicrobium salinarum]|uniref:non-specific protein-tyrosine kinase n=1 Tax=Brumimicrobium salinarum TaxID=2058658 RepID=A0A2I0R055_9FLAO|nr:tyrosine-protein kinase [Brumimicrobium salinarum]PKR79947.1 hypothetical protein CW751_12760 [Brumimicrobium salinarum]
MEQQYFEQPEDNINVQEILRKYLQHWKWILLFVFLTCGTAFFYLKVQPSTYISTASVLVKDDKKGSLGSNVDIFSDLGLAKGNSNLHNEIEVFKSRDLIQKVVRKLGLNAQLTQKNTPLTADVYYYKNKTPFRFIFADSTQQKYKHNFTLVIDKVNNTNVYIQQKTNENGQLKTTTIGEVKYDHFFNTKAGAVKIIKTEHFTDEQLGEKFNYKFQSLAAATDRWKASFEVNTVNKDASVLTLSAKGVMKQANNDFIDQLIIEHEENAIADKNEITKNTSAFISERMKVIEEELSDVETTNEQFKVDNRLVDVQKNAEISLEQDGAIEKEIVSTNIQMSLAAYMVDYLSEIDNYNTLLPANLGLMDQSVNQMIVEYNKLVMERNKYIQGASESNPLAVKLERQIASLKPSITQSLKASEESLKMKLKKLNKEASKYKGQIADIPEFERRYREIQRQLQIKETLYLYLLQKREENEIAMASTLGNVKIIDRPYANNNPIAPKKKIIFLAAFILGIALPVALIYVRDLLDNKIRSVEELEETDLPVVGNIPQSKKREDLFTVGAERSVIAEAYRMLRTNMNFLLEKKEEGHVVFLSSSIAAEGKTYTAMNLANTLALTQKKVILVGLDLRAPKLAKYLGHKEGTLGVSNYLANEDLQLNDLIMKPENDIHYDYIFSGAIPPNPSELLTRPRMKEMFEQLKQTYDYVIVDTSPMALVVDTMSVLTYADLLLYVVRANHAEKASIAVPQRLKKEGKIDKIAFVLNGSTRQNGGYGYGNYGYGYGVYGSEKKKKRWFKG